MTSNLEVPQSLSRSCRQIFIKNDKTVSRPVIIHKVHVQNNQQYHFLRINKAMLQRRGGQVYGVGVTWYQAPGNLRPLLNDGSLNIRA